MPSYSGHTTINFSLASATCVYAVTTLQYEPMGIAICAFSFAFATLFLSPDLDLYHSSPTKNWGVFKLLWFPYSLFFKHRGISHNLLFSTFSRMVYLSLVTCVLFLAFHFFKIYALDSDMTQALQATKQATGTVASPLVSFGRAYQYYITLVMGGFFAADTLHILSDRIYSVLKKLPLVP